MRKGSWNTSSSQIEPSSLGSFTGSKCRRPGSRSGAGRIERQPLSAAGPALDAAGFGQDRQYRAQRKGRHRELHAAQLQRRPAECESGNQAYESRDRHRRQRARDGQRAGERAGSRAQAVLAVEARRVATQVAIDGVHHGADVVHQALRDAASARYCDAAVALARQRARGGRYDDARTLLKLIDVLDDDDDVQTVWGNYEVADAILEKLAG